MPSRMHRDIFARDVEWTEARGGVTYVRLQVEPERPESPVMLVVRFPPHYLIAPHTHDTNYMEYLISGELTVGTQTFGPGDIRLVRSGGGYGPLSSGPDGAEVVIVFENGAATAVQFLPREKAAQPVSA